MKTEEENTSVFMEIPGYLDLYEISDTGEVRNMETGKPLKHTLNKHSGFYTVGLRKEGKTRNKYVHRLVAEAHLGLPSGAAVGFKDGDTSNMVVSNLIIGDQQEIVKKNIEREEHKDLPKEIVYSEKAEAYFVHGYNEEWDEVNGDPDEMFKWYGPFKKLLVAKTHLKWLNYTPPTEEQLKRDIF